MCDFCDKIYDFDEYVGKDTDYISQDEKGTYWIHASIGDKQQQGLLYDVKYCPYCARKLKE